MTYEAASKLFSDPVSVRKISDSPIELKTNKPQFSFLKNYFSLKLEEFYHKSRSIDFPHENQILTNSFLKKMFLSLGSSCRLVAAFLSKALFVIQYLSFCCFFGDKALMSRVNIHCSRCCIIFCQTQVINFLSSWMEPFHFFLCVALFEKSK